MPAGPRGDLVVPSGPALLLSGARQAGGGAVDVRIVGDRIESVGPAGSLSAPERLDLTGYLLLPAPAEPHAHLDEAFSATASAGPEHGRPTEPGQRAEDLQRRITEAALSGLGYGATAQRTHVRVGGAHGLLGMAAALQAARAVHGLMDLQVVPLPGPLTGAGGADQLSLLREALAMGAHAVGGCPDRDRNPGAHLDAVIALAEEYRLPIDLHTDAADPRRFARLAAALESFRSQVTVGPCAAWGLRQPELAARSLELLADAGITVVCLPQSGLCTGSGPLPVPVGSSLRVPVRHLLAAGVAVAAGSGALRDGANPVGRVDPLEAAFLLTASGEVDETAAYETVSGAARRAMGLAPVLLSAGSPAEILAVRGESLRGVLSGGHSRLVVHAGRMVSRTSAVREFAHTTVPAVPRQGRTGPVSPD